MREFVGAGDQAEVAEAAARIAKMLELESKGMEDARAEYERERLVRGLLAKEQQGGEVVVEWRERRWRMGSR